MTEGIINEIPKDILLRGVISKNLKLLRKNHGMTQDDLSRITGIHRVTIAKYENCKTSISLENLLIIAKALGESPTDILDGWEKIL